MTGTARTATTTVTWTPPAVSVWHDELVIDGRPYPTRHSTPDLGPSSHAYLSDLTDAQLDSLRAVHESAHAVAGLAAGAYVHYARIDTTAGLRNASSGGQGPVFGGDTRTCNLSDGLGFAILMGAGERAEDRWLRERDLWTPVRAVGIELGAYSDRGHVLDLNPHMGFEGGLNDYSVVHHFADRFVSEHWDAITAVAAALATRLHLTGDEISDLAGLPNGAHSATCNA